MENWDTMQNHVEHNNWYNLLAANIKTEPGTLNPTHSHMENYFTQQQDQISNNNKHNNNHTCGNSSDQQQKYFNTINEMHKQLMQQQQYNQHFQQAQKSAAQNLASSHLPLYFNPLTPPGLPQAVLPAISNFYTSSTHPQRNQQKTPSPLTILENSALTPRKTPPTDITPPKSPKANNSVNTTDHQQDQKDNNANCNKDDNKKRNSRGRKNKNYRCKYCDKVDTTKFAIWEHAKTHMKPERMLQCSKCPFVTELKQHLKSHTLNHKNLKPFRCNECSYSCVSKAMLKSHLKIHSTIYPYRCADCDRADKHLHSFKLHLRKSNHKPGVILDEEGEPNPSAVIDVYGTRRGPKKKGSRGTNLRKSNASLRKPNAGFKKFNGASTLAASLPDFPINTENQVAVSLSKSGPSDLTINKSLQQQQQNIASHISPSQQPKAASQHSNTSNILNPLNFLPYLHLNIQMLAAHHHAVLAQFSPRMNEQLMKLQQQQDQNNELEHIKENDSLAEDNEEAEEEQECDHKSVGSEIVLTEGTRTKDEQQQHQTPPDLAINLKLAEDNIETPVFPSAAVTRRKWRVLKLDQEQLAKANQISSAPTSPQAASGSDKPTSSSPITVSSEPTNKTDDHSSADESMETNKKNNNNNPSNNRSTSTASSSGNSSNSSSTAASRAAPADNSSPSTTPTLYECKYCDIFFKNTVLYTIHMGYHSCDDVFKCNMCGEKCDGPVGLFVHMARNAHS